MDLIGITAKNAPMTLTTVADIGLIIMKEKITEFTETESDAIALKKQVLLLAPKMVEKLQTVFEDKKLFINSDQEYAYDKLWPLITEIILEAKDLKKITAHSTKGVIDALSKGKITAQEAIQLMTMLKTKSEIDELPKLLEMMENLQEQQK